LKKVIFFDRDGVINNNSKYYVYNIADVAFNPNLFEVCNILKSKGYEFIIISNQSGVSKHVYKKTDVEKVHEFMRSEFKKNGIDILEFYYCTHHPDVENCLCRKPQTLLVEKAVARFNIDVTKSYFVGDKETDVQTAINYNIKPILIEPNSDLFFILSKIKNP